MEVNREIVRDLIPAVAAGEASAASQAAVEEWAGRDPSVAAELASLRSSLGILAATPRGAPRPELERDVVRQVRRKLDRRSGLLAAAIFFTVLPLTFGFTPRGLEYFMLRDNPGAAAASLAVAAACWVGFARGRRAYRGS